MPQGRTHRYAVNVEWTGNHGTGTANYLGYGREHTIRAAGKPDLLCSSDPQLHGDPAKYNPEDMLVAALSACHMMTYLRMAAEAGVAVTAYTDSAEGVAEESTGAHFGGRFREVILHPVVTITAASDPAKALAAQEDAHRACFIANSVNFAVRLDPKIVAERS